jgi:hypothetical protein
LRRLIAALAAFAALAVVGSANADPMRYGVADDWPKFHPCGDVWWQSAKDIGYQDLRMTVQWNEATPTTIPFQANLKAAIDCALLNNVRPILSIYPLHPSAIGSSDGQQQAFAGFVALVGQAFPQVKNIIVGNEPNVNRFWQPQYTGGQDAAARDYEHTAAYSYDKLKVARPDATVWGPAISSRGNDNATAASNPSHSPVWFIKYMGDAYRVSGRTKPIFDEFNMHPYPPTQDTDPFSKPFQWPQGGAANLDRIKQALYDAFHGTGQATPAEQATGATARFAGQGVPMNLDEAGEQTVVTGHDGAYNSPSESISPISEAQQSTNHVELAEIAACDPDVKALLYFPLIDDTSLSSGFQSGNLFADLAHKQSYAGVKNKIASAKGNCQGQAKNWQHTTSVIGAQGVWGGPGTDAGSQAPTRPSKVTGLQTGVTVNEDATYVATLVRVAAGGTQTPVGAAVTGTAQAYFKPVIKFSSGPTPFADGAYQYIVKLTAATTAGTPNVRTTTLTSNVFTIGVAPASGLTTSQALLNFNGAFAQLFKTPLDPQAAMNYVYATINLMLSFIQTQLGQTSQNLTGSLSFLPATAGYRTSQSAAAKLPVYKLPVTKAGQKLKLPKIGKLPAGSYRAQFALKGADGSKATLTTPTFTVDAKGKVSFGKAAPAKKPVKKPKPKPKPKQKQK